MSPFPLSGCITQCACHVTPEISLDTSVHARTRLEPLVADWEASGTLSEVSAQLSLKVLTLETLRNIVDCFVHDDVIKSKHFPRYWPFVRGIHRSPVNSPHKGQWRGALMFSLNCVWINGWVNNREAGDLRRNRAHYEITVMMIFGRLNWNQWLPEKCRTTWWREMETFSTLLALCEGNPPATIHRPPVDSHHKDQRRGDSVFSLIGARTNGQANSQDTGDLRLHGAHCDVTVMKHI